MARTVSDLKLDTRAARRRLEARREPYWRALSEGMAVGYRRGSKGGTWIAKHYTPEHGRRLNALGTTDDVVDADGVHVLTFAQAQERARAWFEELARLDSGDASTAQAGPYTVSDAIAAYLQAYEAGQTKGGGKASNDTKAAIEAFIRPRFGDRPLTALKKADIEAWHRKLATTPPRKRSVSGQAPAYRDVDMTDEDIIRQRRASANRILTVLKAVLNRAPREHHGGNEHAWGEVKPFKEVDAPTVRWLEPAEAKRLLNAASADLRTLAAGALYTGARYSELARWRVRDFSSTASGIHVRKAKGQKPRFIHLTDEGVRFFERQCLDKAADSLIFVRSNAAPWKKSDQFRPIKDASAAANIAPAIGFHILRHTYGSWLAMKGVPMNVIAAQLGHADTRVTERHYAHLAPSYVGSQVRQAFGEIGLTPADTVVPIHAGKPAAEAGAASPLDAVDTLLSEVA